MYINFLRSGCKKTIFLALGCLVHFNLVDVFVHFSKESSKTYRANYVEIHPSVDLINPLIFESYVFRIESADVPSVSRKPPSDAPLARSYRAPHIGPGT